MTTRTGTPAPAGPKPPASPPPPPRKWDPCPACDRNLLDVTAPVCEICDDRYARGSAGPMPLRRVLADIAAEREYQDRKWGTDRHHIGVPFPTAPTKAPRLPGHLAAWAAHVLGIPTREAAQIACERAAADGEITWGHILVEEVAESVEVAACGAAPELRAELVQVAAVVAAWIEDLDRQGGGR